VKFKYIIKAHGIPYIYMCISFFCHPCFYFYFIQTLCTKEPFLVHILFSLLKSYIFKFNSYYSINSQSRYKFKPLQKKKRGRIYKKFIFPVCPNQSRLTFVCQITNLAPCLKLYPQHGPTLEIKAYSRSLPWNMGSFFFLLE
jgi:hypothetical protein